MEPSAVSMKESANINKKPLSMTTTKTKSPRCVKFAGGDNQRGAFRVRQLRFPCKLRRYICARCGMGRGEHRHAGVRDELLPPRKRSVFRRLVQFMERNRKKKKRTEAALEEEGFWNWSGRAVTNKGKRGPRRKRAEVLCVDWLRI